MKLVILSILLSFSVLAKDIVLTEENSVSINQPISSEFIGKKSLELLAKAGKLSSGSDMYLVLATPGGEVMAGSLFIDLAKNLHVKVHTITIFAASMGYQIVQNLGTRYIMPSGTLMSHRASVGGVGGQINGELNARVKYLTDVANRLDVIAAKRSNQSLESYQASIVNELWLTSGIAVMTNHADEIANVSCDKKLAGQTKFEIVETMFGSLKVEFSKCPLILAPVSIQSNNKKAKERAAQYFKDYTKFTKGETL